jgi:hypothetical protein
MEFMEIPRDSKLLVFPPLIDSIHSTAKLLSLFVIALENFSWSTLRPLFFLLNASIDDQYRFPVQILRSFVPLYGSHTTCGAYRYNLTTKKHNSNRTPQTPNRRR